MKQTIFLFSGLSLAIMLLFQLSKYSLLYQQIDLEIYILIFGILFIFLGIGIGRLVKQQSIEQSIDAPKDANNSPQVNQSELEKTGLSKREYEILLLIAEGQSNSEIAQQLFIAESTVKTHVSKILSKLNAKRRTQAVQIGRELNII